MPTKTLKAQALDFVILERQRCLRTRHNIHEFNRSSTTRIQSARKPKLAVHTSIMTILLTGSAGKTASALAETLTPEHAILVASRRPNAESKYPTVRFDWLDDKTWPNIFFHAQTQASPIAAAYLVVPDLPDARAKAVSFIRHCISNNVRRFVLLSAWENPEGGSLLGGVHSELKSMGEKEGIGWAVLRPHFFMGKSELMENDAIS